MQNPKSLVQSKTFWFGLGQLVFGAIGLFTGWIESGTATTLILTGFASIGLRTATDAPVSGMFRKK